MNSMTFKHIQLLVVLAALLSGVTAQQSPLPYERYFFTSMSFISGQTFVKNSNSHSRLLSMLQSVESTDGLVEMRLAQPFADASSNVGDLDDGKLLSWQLWDSVDSWLTRPALFQSDSDQGEFLALTSLSDQYFGVTSEFQTCSYCNEALETNPVFAHFENLQSLGQYPIQATFSLFLASQTQVEPATLDYLATQLITGQPATDTINFNFDRIDFWEMYATPDGFNQHVFNVNVTLAPQAANWFVDLGNSGTTW